MAIKFQFGDYRWAIQEGGPPAISRENPDAPFLPALKNACEKLQKYTHHEMVSWIVARLNAVTSACLELEGDLFEHDTDEFGYKFKLCNAIDEVIANGAVVFERNRTYFASVSRTDFDFQSLFVSLLVDEPDFLAKCEITVRHPETRKKRKYGWNGYMLLT